MPGSHAPSVHQLKISLEGAAPPLWPRIQVPSAANLGFLHDVIQEAFGWEGYHRHRFRDGRDREWGDPSFTDDGFGATFADEEQAGLGKVLRTEGVPAAAGQSLRPRTSGGSGGWKRSPTWSPIRRQIRRSSSKISFPSCATGITTRVRSLPRS